MLSGQDALRSLGSDLDELHVAVAAPFTARRPWLQTWIDCYHSYVPLIVGVRRTGRIEAVAPLAYRRRRGAVHVVTLGHGPSDEARLPASDAAGALALALTVAGALADLAKICLVDLRHLSPDEAAVPAVIQAIGHGWKDPGDVSPRLRLGLDRSLRSYVTRNHHQQRRRLVNRIQRAGLRLEVRQVSEPDEVDRLLPGLERLCHERDLAVRGWSRLDDPEYAQFLRKVVSRHAALGAVELTTLTLDGDLAAYLLCFRDGSARRMWHARVRPRWQQYGPGRVATDAAVEAALADPACAEFDWMRGAEPYKFSLSDHVYRAVNLYACTSGPAWVPYAAALRTRSRLRDVRDVHPALSRGWQRARPVMARLGGPL